MNPFDIKDFLSKFFIFQKELPGHHITASNRIGKQAFVVSPIRHDTIQKIRAELDFMLEKEKVDWEEDKIVPSISSTEVSMLYGNIKLEISGNTYILFNGGNNPVFGYCHAYCYLGSILGTVLKNIDEGLILQENALVYRKTYYIKENDNQTIIEKVVTEDFFEILELLQLPTAEFMRGFRDKGQYLHYLAKSPYINVTTLSRIKKCKVDFINQFYEFVKKKEVFYEQKRKSIVGPDFEKEKLLKFFQSFNFPKFNQDYKRRLKLHLDVEDKLQFNNLIVSLKGFVDSSIVDDKRKMGQMLADYKKHFGSKNSFRQYVHLNSRETVLKSIESFAGQWQN